jgi:hypothetical protein
MRPKVQFLRRTPRYDLREASTGELRMFPRWVRRDVIVLLCLKAAALTLIYFLLIKPAMVPEPQPATMATHLIGS